MLIAPLGHPLAEREAVSPEEIGEWPAIVPSSDAPRPHFSETALRRHGGKAHIAIEATGWGEIKRYVEAGLGIALFPRFAITGRDRIAVIHSVRGFEPLGLGLYTLPRRPLPHLAERLVRSIEAGIATWASPRRAAESFG